ncbi:MAG TPA: Gfo/Idh/MocA family oxidoreductase [Pyrinomonadaceae bacterium]|nr:Gfo/Idh/MocA family oxidoreductase [Pyrinomonadaceae bacterium]
MGEDSGMASEKDSIGIGIIGAGFARTTQIPAFKACVGARLVAIASRHRANAERVASEFGIEHVAGDWREVVERADVDLVSIVTPPSTHAEMTIAALDAGRAVLCEKPMAMNALETDAMRRRASEAGVLALIDHELRFVPGREKMREMVQQGEIGQIRHAKMLFRADSRASAERPWDWWSDVEAGGGTLGAIGSHAIDAFRWVLGAEVSKVFCQLATHVKERAEKETDKVRPVTTDDEANLLLRFADSALMQDATGTVSLSMVEPGRAEHRLEIFGTEGALMIEDDGVLWHARTGACQWQEIETKHGELAAGMRDSSWSRGFTTFSHAIITALREGRTDIEEAATFEDGHRTQLVLDAARRSHHSGMTESV